MADELNGQPDADPTTDDVQPGAEPVENLEDEGFSSLEDAEADADSFSRGYVEKLRRQNAGEREKANAALTRMDAAEKQLHGVLVAATNRLADPNDLEYSPEHLTSPEALTAAIDALIEAKPHLKSRRPSGDVGQGPRGSADAQVNLLDLLRSRA